MRGKCTQSPRDVIQALGNGGCPLRIEFKGRRVNDPRFGPSTLLFKSEEEPKGLSGSIPLKKSLSQE